MRIARHLLLLIGAWFLTGCITSIDGKVPPRPQPKVAAQTYLQLGLAYMGKGRYDLAETKFQRSIMTNATPDAYNALALLYEERHDNALAEENYRQLLSLFPEYGRGYLNYMIFLCKNNRNEQLQELVSLTSRQEQEIAAIGSIAAGDCAMKQGHIRDAEAYYLGALQYEEHAGGALLPLAEIYRKRKQFAKAKARVEHVNNYIGYSPQSLYLSALIARDLGETERMNFFIKELGRRFRTSKEAIELLGK